MNSSLQTKGEVLVVGGSGSMGWPICRALIADGYQVISLTRGIHPRPEEYALHLNGTTQKVPLREISCNVTSINSDHLLNDIWIKLSRPLSAIVYAVGDCPPGKFDSAVKLPLCDIDDGILSHELNIHVIGLLNVVRKLHTCLQPSGHVVVISSAITRLTDATCPPWLHAGHYAAAKAAQDELVRWFRRDPCIKDRNILVHRLAPAAVDTPFHQGCEHQPPAMLSVDDVAQRVLDALQSTAVIDEIMMPPQATIIAG
jgi:NAD(P)-dependent dehydrogenase (short-subunit alcohol dehydrogenase family)